MPPSDIHEELVVKSEELLAERGYKPAKRNPVTTVRADAIGTKKARGRRFIWLIEAETCKSIHTSQTEDQMLDLDRFARTQAEWDSARVSLCVPKECRRQAAQMLREVLGPQGLVELVAMRL